MDEAEILAQFSKEVAQKTFVATEKPDFRHALGIDPSMSSSGLCLVTFDQDDTPVRVLTNKFTTSPATPTPLRLNAVVKAARQLLQEAMELCPPAVFHEVSICFEAPPPTSQSSGYLFALNQLLWTAFQDNTFIPEAFRKTTKGYVYAINAKQLKSVYVGWARDFDLDYTSAEINKKKSYVVKIIKEKLNTLGLSAIQSLLPTRYNNDVAEAIILALMAEDVTSMLGDRPTDWLLSKSVLMKYALNQELNSAGQRRGWLYRPLEYSWKWL
jgi:hypothetical protein